MWQASPKIVTDVGLKDPCENIRIGNETIAQYFSEQMNITDSRGISRVGWCLPKECTQDDVGEAVTKIQTYMNDQLAILPDYGIKINTLIFNSDSRMTMKFFKSDEYVQKWHDNTKTGTIIVVTIVFVILIFQVSANIWLMKNGNYSKFEELTASEETVDSTPKPI